MSGPAGGTAENKAPGRGNMPARSEILLSGFGGQGVVLAGRCLGTAATRAGFEATMLVSHGTETRGGYVRSQVVVALGEIDSPVVEKPDFFLALSQAAYNRFKPLAAFGLTLYDSQMVSPDGALPGRDLGLPARELARSRLGDELAANMISLGVILRLLGGVPLAEGQRAARELSKRGGETNVLALELGWNLDLG